MSGFSADHRLNYVQPPPDEPSTGASTPVDPHFNHSQNPHRAGMLTLPDMDHTPTETTKTPPESTPKRDPATRQDLNIRSTVGFNDWIAEFAADQRTTMSGLVELALIDYAKGTDFESDIPQRVARG